MAPPRKPVPPGFAVKYLELGGQYKGPGGLVEFYAVDDRPSTLVGAETGTMLKIAPKSYDIAPDWQNTFITATIWRDGHFHLEPAVYSAGSLRWRDCRY